MAFSHGWASRASSFYPQKPRDLNFESFNSIGSFLYNEDISYSHVGWRGRMRAYAGIGGTLPKEKVDEFDKEIAQVLKEKFPQEPMKIPHRVWAEAWKLRL